MIRQRQAEFILFFALSSVLVDAEQAHPRPNILVIISDDQGWADVGYHGSEILTPNIDRLAKEGLVLDQHYVTPMCSSTRACLLSGRYSTRFGLDGATNSQVFPFGTITLASALKGLGYNTGITGKWHLGSIPQAGPFKFGFNRSYGSFAGGVDQYTHLYKKGKFSNTWHRNDQYVEEEGHATDLIAREAIRWIEAKGEAPFYIQVAFTAVHVPIQEPEKWVKRYADKIENESRRRYAACATHMDDAIGQMLSALKRTGQWEDTLVLFTSDNGGSGGWRPTGKYPGKYEASPVLGNNLPLRGRKGSVYEGGIRVPACVSWPGVLKPGKVAEPIHIVDWMPTLLSLLGYEVEEDLGWDGMNMWPLLTGKQAKLVDREFYFKRGSSTALRYGDWKLVQSGKRQELFNLANDPNEKSNLAPEQKELVASLSVRLNRQRERDR